MESLEPETILAIKITRMEKLGLLDPNCLGCAEQYANPNAMAPSHKASERCESGKRPHCTCDVCFQVSFMHSILIDLPTIRFYYVAAEQELFKLYFDGWEWTYEIAAYLY